MTTCSSTENKSTMQYYPYPPPIARFEDVIANPKLFMDTLGNFHAAMGTRFMIPIVGGRDLDLHRLFMEVTSRGGIKKVLEEKKWKEVTNCFSFPPSATNASFILRKYYMSLIQHFEQVYYFKAKAWTPVSADTWQNTKYTLTSTSTSTSGMDKPRLPLPEFQMDSTQVIPVKRQRAIIEDSLPKASPEPIGFPVTGIIDGKFESGYLCTVSIGGERLRGVLYEPTQHPSYQTSYNHGVVTQCQTTSTNVTHPSTMVRRRRRKKCEIKKRDPAHPKPNRSGYNFFFSEQHARLKPLHPGKDRDISRMIGELWNAITDSERAVYQEKALKDKERYRTEKEHYMESLRTGQLISNAVPFLQQMHSKTPATDGGSSSQTVENELNPTFCDKSSFENAAETSHKECLRDVEMDPKNELLLVKELQSNESTMLHNDQGNETNYQFVVENRTSNEPEALKVSVDINENVDQELDDFQRCVSKGAYDITQNHTMSSNEPESFPI
ncbi:ARID DNA-binding domain, High mobility group box domain protein [Artemisia annua]|uniref:ARID DNA-binding domain, High mobility group box domain protein n=1 Tax=Artemisia annua TaxID=35608 RepID=A0A2U1PYW6_ARTAN|nr:ARID DNA-binding domain, High mobility group box domain protein [Artemisia annua]